jgi:hypothetical protein
VDLAWTVLTLAGMVWFGREAWQRHADVFAIYFNLLGRFAPLAATTDARALVLRWPGSGLLVQDAPSPVAFVVAMLATVLSIIAEPLVRFREPDPSYSFRGGVPLAASPIDQAAPMREQESVRL